jgi:sugar phosphate isomerase/epimerase
MYRGGQNPIEWMTKHADRVILSHQKDFPEDAPQPLNLFDGVVSPTENIDMAVFEERKDKRCFTEIGTGVLPIQDILDTVSALPNFEYLFLEQDHTAMDEIESVRFSHKAFDSKFTGIAWN